MRYSLFWYVTHSRLVGLPTDISGQPIGPISRVKHSKNNSTVLGCDALSLDGYIPRILRIAVPSYSRLRSRRRLPDPVVEGITILRNIRKCTAAPPRLLVSAATSLGESELSPVRDLSLFKTFCPFVATSVEETPQFDRNSCL